MIVNSGIKRVVYKKKYPATINKDILDDAGVEAIEFAEK
jgi:deoxycytidylate deaminase